MKRMLAGLLVVLGLGAGTLFAQEGYGYGRDRDDHWREKERLQQRIAHDRWELQRDLDYGDYRGARHEQHELDHAYRELEKLQRYNGSRDYDDDHREYRGGYYDQR